MFFSNKLKLFFLIFAFGWTCCSAYAESKVCLISLLAADQLNSSVVTVIKESAAKLNISKEKFDDSFIFSGTILGEDMLISRINHCFTGDYTSVILLAHTSHDETGTSLIYPAKQVIQFIQTQRVTDEHLNWALPQTSSVKTITLVGCHLEGLLDSYPTLSRFILENKISVKESPPISPTDTRRRLASGIPLILEALQDHSDRFFCFVHFFSKNWDTCFEGRYEIRVLDNQFVGQAHFYKIEVFNDLSFTVYQLDGSCIHTNDPQACQDTQAFIDSLTPQIQNRVFLPLSVIKRD